MIYNIGDRIITKKPHPCGNNSWTIVRVGADIKIKCDKCAHIVMIDLDKFPKTIKQHFPIEVDNER